MIELTQKEVDDLEEGETIFVRWADRNLPQKEYKVIIHEDFPAVREVKPSGFAVVVSLYPVADKKGQRRMRVFKEETRKPIDGYW